MLFQLLYSQRSCFRLSYVHLFFFVRNGADEIVNVVMMSYRIHIILFFFKNWTNFIFLVQSTSLSRTRRKNSFIMIQCMHGTEDRINCLIYGADELFFMTASLIKFISCKSQHGYSKQLVNNDTYNKYCNESIRITSTSVDNSFDM